MDAHFDAHSARSVSPRPYSMHPIRPSTSARSTPGSQTIQLPPVEERSSFSPVSPNFSRWKEPPTANDIELARTRAAPLPPKARRKCSDILFNWRIRGGFAPAHRPTTFETWGPAGDLKITTVKQKQRSRWHRVFIALLVLILLALIGNLVYLDVRVANGTLGGGGGSVGAISTPTTLSFAATQCLFQFNLSAPLAPTQYPCSPCVQVLTTIPTPYLKAHPEDAQAASDATQFCGIQSLFNSAGAAGGAALQKIGWMQDNSICTWSGITCDSTGHVSTLEMVFPAIPTALPDDMGLLDQLTSLKIVGNGAIPSGALPSTLTRATKLSALHLEATALTGPIEDNLLAAWAGLSSLTLVRNLAMGPTLPFALGLSPLQTLIVNGQNLNNFILLSSSAMTASLTTLDLSSNALTGPVFALFSAFTQLKELRLSSNKFTGPLPTLAPSLQVLTLDHNPGLGNFQIPAALCASKALVTCDFRGTAFSNQTVVPSCGVCQF